MACEFRRPASVTNSSQPQPGVQFGVQFGVSMVTRLDTKNCVKLTKIRAQSVAIVRNTPITIVPYGMVRG